MNFEHTDHTETIFADSGLRGHTATSLSFEDVASLIPRFPKTRYYGSKRRLLGWIHQALKDLPFNTALDDVPWYTRNRETYASWHEEFSVTDRLRISRKMWSERPPTSTDTPLRDGGL